MIRSAALILALASYTLPMAAASGQEASAPLENTGTAGVAETPDPRPELWNGLRLGMTPAEATVILTAMPKVKSVKLKKPDRYGIVSMVVNTGWSLLEVAGQSATVKPIFLNGQLSEVVIDLYPGTRPYCSIEVQSAYRLVVDLLAIKYEAQRSALGLKFTNGLIVVDPQLTTKIGSSDYDLGARMCREKGEGFATSSFSLRYMSKNAADAASEVKRSAAEAEVNNALNGL